MPNLTHNNYSAQPQRCPHGRVEKGFYPVEKAGGGRGIGHGDGGLASLGFAWRGRRFNPADQIHMQGARTMRAAESYTVHEIQATNGTKVREYISRDGKVFAVA